MKCQQCGDTLQEGARFCPKCGAVQLCADGSLPPPDEKISSDILMESYPMKWYKALIYVLLFLEALNLFINGLQLLSGSAYGDGYEAVYKLYPGLKTLSMAMGAAYLVLAAAYLLVRQMLSGFRKRAPQFLLGLYIVDICVALIYCFATMLIVKESLFTATMVVSMIFGTAVSLVFFLINRVYFKKRQGLFVN